MVLRAPPGVQDDNMMTKRVTAVAGDRVCRRGADGALEPEHVPIGCVWVEGDNAQNSMDSNNFGAVATDLIEAKVILKLWPPNEFGRIPSVAAM